MAERILIDIATTEGQATVRAAEFDAEAPRSAMVRYDQNHVPVGADAHFDAFDRNLRRHLRGLGIETPAGGLILELDAPVDAGSSWQLGLTLVHLALAGGRLATSEAEADRVVWVTGAVGTALWSAREVEAVARKIGRSAGRLERLRAGGLAVTLLVPEANLEEARLAAPPWLVPEAVGPVAALLPRFGPAPGSGGAAVRPAAAGTAPDAKQDTGTAAPGRAGVSHLPAAKANPAPAIRTAAPPSAPPGFAGLPAGRPPPATVAGTPRGGARMRPAHLAAAGAAALAALAGAALLAGREPAGPLPESRLATAAEPARRAAPAVPAISAGSSAEARAGIATDPPLGSAPPARTPGALRAPGVPQAAPRTPEAPMMLAQRGGPLRIEPGIVPRADRVPARAPVADRLAVLALPDALRRALAAAPLRFRAPPAVAAPAPGGDAARPDTAAAGADTAPRVAGGGLAALAAAPRSGEAQAIPPLPEMPTAPLRPADPEAMATTGPEPDPATAGDSGARALAAHLLRSGGEHGCALDGFRGIAPVASPLERTQDGAPVGVDPFLCGLAFAPAAPSGTPSGAASPPRRVEVALEPRNPPGIAVERIPDGGLALRIDHRRFRGAVGVTVWLAEPGAPAPSPDARETLRLRLEAAPGAADARSLHGFDPAWDRLLGRP